MPTNSQEEPVLDTGVENKDFNQQDLFNRYLKTEDVDITNLIPFQKETGIKLEEKQEETRSKLATFLIKMLATTLVSSFLLVVILILSTSFMDEKKAEFIEKKSTLVKDLVTFIITAQTGLIGTALGFYFGSKSND